MDPESPSHDRRVIVEDVESHRQSVIALGQQQQATGSPNCESRIKSSLEVLSEASPSSYYFKMKDDFDIKLDDIN